MEKLINKIFLGSGGQNPRLDVLDIVSGVITTLFCLPKGQSVYAINVNPDNGILYCATKGGFIYLFNLFTLNGEKVSPLRVIAHGAPVLSLCMLNSAKLAVCDTVGRCLLWNTDMDSFDSFNTHGKVIISLVPISKSTLTGIASDGSYLFLDIEDITVTKCIPLPIKPSLTSLFSSCYWQAIKATVYPGTNGQLVLIDPIAEVTHQQDAHQDKFLAMTVWDNVLLTAGLSDGQIKFWHADPFLQPQLLKIPPGVISVTVTGSPEPQMLLIDQSGCVFVFHFNTGRLQESVTIPYGDYRVSTAINFVTQDAWFREQQRDEVERIIDTISLSYKQGNVEELESLHNRLVDLGYKHVSLQMRVNDAVNRNDIISEIKFRSSLVEILPRDNPKSFDSVEKFALLLEKTWHLKRSAEHVKAISAIDPEYKFNLSPQLLFKKEQFLNNNNSIVKPDLNIDILIQSATVLSKFFTGRYLLNRLTPLSCGDISINGNSIVEKYHQILDEKSGGISYPIACQEQPWLLTGLDLQQIEIVSFGDGKTNQFEGLQFALQIIHGGLEVFISPVILFDWRNINRPSVRHHNQLAMQALNQIRNKELSYPYLSLIHEMAQYAVRRIVTDFLSR